MKLSQALQIVRRAPSGPPSFRLFINCGFTALHFQTFLQAHLQQALPALRVEMEGGLFGDSAGNLREVAGRDDAGLPSALAFPLEWTDLDTRLGYRVLGGWGATQEADIVKNCDQSLARLGALLKDLTARQVPIALSLPTLPLPPAFHTNGWESGAYAAELVSLVGNFGAGMASLSSLALVNAGRLDKVSPAAGRLDLKSDIHSGLPYSLEHCSAVAEALAHLLAPAPAKKGLITDLDDTLWAGIVGETGPADVAWDLHGAHQLHGIYQQTLRALSEQGALLAVASKNSEDVAGKALGRTDLLIPADLLFPKEINWGPKSQSVERILRAWNVGADSVMFIDDSPLELAEVASEFPDVECVLFPKNDFAGALALFSHLRDRFGKRRLNEEDTLRRESIRRASAFAERADEADRESAEGFLSSLEARWTLHPDAAADSRALELINKTNQFNANGRRFEAGGWRELSSQPGAFVWAISYQDKFGPLGKIAVAAGAVAGDTLLLSAWVLSCRAFSRRIEFQTLAQLLSRYPQTEFIEIEAATTGRNQPFWGLMSHFGFSEETGRRRIGREACLAALPALYHQVEISFQENSA